MAKNIILGNKLTSKKIWGLDSGPAKNIKVQKEAREVPPEILINYRECKWCGRVLKSPAGLRTHLRWCKKKKGR